MGNSEKKLREKREKDGLVLNVASMVEAGMFAEVLQNAGIPCIIKGHGAGDAMRIYMGYSAAGFGIYVEPERREEARTLLTLMLTPVDGDWEEE